MQNKHMKIHSHIIRYVWRRPASCCIVDIKMNTVPPWPPGNMQDREKVRQLVKCSSLYPYHLTICPFILGEKWMLTIQILDI
jgi:hypothetical protein